MAEIDLLTPSPYLGYAYAYPHKTAYRPLTPPVRLRDLWATENKEALFLYLHLPFCARRCGYCNLFALPGASPDFVTRYLDALQRQAHVVCAELGAVSFSRLAIGGGTPTYLTAADLERLCDVCAVTLHADAQQLPTSVETSPATADPERLRVLRARGVQRISLGVQSFHAAELAALGRFQTLTEIHAALTTICDLAFPVVNLDLIYGLPGQTRASWDASLRQALAFAPTELYLYPLYIRPLTGLARGVAAVADQRLSLYRHARERLLDAGYTQSSMRRFHKVATSLTPAPPYRCQEDGMIGLGCGPRSYTRNLHYATAYAVGPRATRAILQAYIARSAQDLAYADCGFWLDADEQRRRYLIKSLLHRDGVARARYVALFGTDVCHDFPQLYDLETRGFMTENAETLSLTPAGLERSDVIGPWLYSPTVSKRMRDFKMR